MPSSALVVDDDPATLSGLTALLGSAGYRVLTADSYEAAAAVLRTERPDILLVDIRLGAFNGLQLIVRGARVPTVVITGHDDPYLETEARRLGADYLVKPVDPKVLMATIARRLTETSRGSDPP